MRLLIVDDHDLVRETIALFLKSEGIMQIAMANGIDTALEEIGRHGGFDLILLDYKLPGVEGLEGLAKVLAANGGKNVALMSGEATPAIAKEAIDAGAAGFVPKTMGAKSIVSAIQFMAAGEIFVPYDFMQQTPAKAVANLTERETEVLRFLVDAKSNKEIARELDLQEVTIKLHVKTLCRKLGAKNRTQAAMIARDKGLA